jgi:hypothetical protein
MERFIVLPNEPRPYFGPILGPGQRFPSELIDELNTRLIALELGLAGFFNPPTNIEKLLVKALTVN